MATEVVLSTHRIEPYLYQHRLYINWMNRAGIKVKQPENDCAMGNVIYMYYRN
jgi:N-dimethylarginine dimethylaminohydrolase